MIKNELIFKFYNNLFNYEFYIKHDHNNLAFQFTKYFIIIIIFETIIYQLLNYLYHNLIVFLSSFLKDKHHNPNHAPILGKKIIYN